SYGFSLGQRHSSNPSAMLAAVLCKRAKLHEELRNIEKQVISFLNQSFLIQIMCIYVVDFLESVSMDLQKTSSKGNPIKFHVLLDVNLTLVETCLKRSRKFQPEDRLFSLSSVTSPAAEEHVVGRDVGGLAANGQGKPKRGRGGPRDAKRIRQSSDADYDYEDDPDLL
ncbi:hypothetical protein C3L33_04241, partial [Rhododendron williamsianum]